MNLQNVYIPCDKNEMKIENRFLKRFVYHYISWCNNENWKDRFLKKCVISFDRMRMGKEKRKVLKLCRQDNSIKRNMF